MKKIITLFITTQVFLVTFHASSQVIHVPGDQPTIQDGINVAGNGDTVLVDTGTYVENINYLGKNIVVASHFLLTGDTTNIDNTLIKSPEADTPTITFNNYEDTTALLIGFTISSYDTTNYWGDCGISCTNSSPRFKDLKIIPTAGYYMGNGLSCDSSNIFLENVEFHDCWHALGIFNSTVTLINTTIKDNGSGISCNNSILNIYYSEIKDVGGGYWDGFSCNNSNVTIEGSTIFNCSPGNPKGPGVGGITINNSSMNIGNSLVSNNPGSGISCTDSDLIAINTIISDNTGGGLYTSGCNVFLQNVTIANNRSGGNGGGIYSENDSSFVFDTVYRCNIYDNISSAEGNDIFSNTPVEVIVDTFSVLNPSIIHAAPLENFTFDIIHGLHMPVSADLYVSPEGDNRNSGLTPDDPFKNIRLALTYILADSLDPHTIHLLPGTYSQSASNEWFPLQPGDYISLEGTNQEEVILNGGSIEIKNSISNSLSGFTVSDGGYGIYCENSSPLLSNITVTNCGIKCVSSNPKMTDMIISNNSIHRPAIDLDSSNAIISDSEISNNGNRGIYCSYSNPVITNSVISFNEGGVHLSYSDAVFTDVEIR